MNTVGWVAIIGVAGVVAFTAAASIYTYRQVKQGRVRPFTQNELERYREIRMLN